MKYYRTNNLYVGLLGDVTSINKDKQIRIESIDKYIICTKLHYYYGDMAKDIFTGKVYYCFFGNINTSKTIEKAIGDCAVYTTSPIELYLHPTNKRKASETELLTILNKLNNPHKEEIKEDEVATQITDSILITILETSDLVKVSEISEKAKEKFVKELEQLAENYVQDMNNLDSNDPFTSEYQIRMNYIKALVEIEEKIKSPSEIKAYNLKRQLQAFKKELNQVD